MKQTPQCIFSPLQYFFERSFLVALVLIFAFSAFFPQAQASSAGSTRITLSQNGTSTTFETTAQTLTAALQEKGITLGVYDALSPDAATPLQGGTLEARVLSPYPITIVDGNMEFLTFTAERTVEKVLSQLKIVPRDTDIVTPPLATTVGQGTRIIITRSHTLLVSDGKKDIEVGTQGNTVADVLSQLKITVRAQDILTPAPTTLVKPGMHVKVVRVDTHETTETSDVAFDTITKDDPTIYHGTSKVGQEGAVGKREKKFRITTHNDEEVSRAELSNVITEKPRPKIILRGTKERVGRVMSGLATWYVNGSGLTCASRDFPNGTRLRVTNLANGTQIIVVVNDYGPTAGGGRIIDLNKNAFAAIGSIGAGVLNVRVEQLL